MGGDRAPKEVAKGAVLAAGKMENVHLYLVGREEEVRKELDAAGWNGSNIDVVPADHVITMSDSPVEALTKKRGSSIEISMRMVREQKAAAVVSAGNTGACVAAASLLLGRLPAVKKSGIAVAFHIGHNPVVIIDVGANVYCKPEHLIQYGIMASIYAEEILNVKNPRVGLLNIGEEDEKGHTLAKMTHSLFNETRLNFIGNIEGAELFKGNVDVVVCDGFVGNIVLKVSEGLAERLFQLFASLVKDGVKSLPNAQGVGETFKKSFSAFESRYDYSEYGGAPLLGVNGNVIIAHGRSDAKAVSNAIRCAGQMTAMDLNSRITHELQSLLKT